MVINNKILLFVNIENEELYTMTIKDFYQKPDGKQAVGVYPFGNLNTLNNN